MDSLLKFLNAKKKTELLCLYFKLGNWSQEDDWMWERGLEFLDGSGQEDWGGGLNGSYQNFISDIKCYTLVYIELVLFHISFKLSAKYLVQTSSA